MKRYEIQYFCGMKNIIKTAAFLLAAMTLTAALISCSARIDGAPEGMKLVSTDDVEYNLYIPESWTADLSTGVVSAYVSENDYSNINIDAFNLDDPNMTPAQFWEKYESDITSTFPDAVFTDSSNTVIDGVLAAEQHTFTAAVTGTEYKFMETVFVRMGSAYILTYTSTAENFDSHLEDVQKIIANISFK